MEKHILFFEDVNEGIGVAYIVTIKTNLYEGRITVKNVLGQEILTIPVINNNQEVDLSNIADGMYYIILQSNENQVIKPIVISK